MAERPKAAKAARARRVRGVMGAMSSPRLCMGHCHVAMTDYLDSLWTTALRLSSEACAIEARPRLCRAMIRMTVWQCDARCIANVE